MRDMTKISKDNVERVARLARLGLSDEEKERFTKNLEGILGHFSSIQHINTENVPTADDASGLHNVTREDLSDDGALCSPDELLARAPCVQDGHIRVKSVFQDETL